MNKDPVPARAAQTTLDETTTVRVWDLPTRIFHWTLVLLIFCAWASWRFSEMLGDYLLVWHRWNGKAILVLLVWRVLWGFAGSSTSRFSTFVRWPWAAADYGLDLARGRDRHFLGHNPLGAYMILALLGAVGVQGTLGLFTVEHNDSGAYGPLYRIVSEPTWKQLSIWHRWWFYWVVLALVPLHILANVLYGVVKKEPLITAMISGRKPQGDYEDADEAELVARPIARAFMCLVAAAAAVFGGIVLAGGRLL
jgi:cytochrome b